MAAHYASPLTLSINHANRLTLLSLLQTHCHAQKPKPSTVSTPQVKRNCGEQKHCQLLKPKIDVTSTQQAMGHITLLNFTYICYAFYTTALVENVKFTCNNLHAYS